jgi:CubicO group peptidase (beta-lactamase class C family)
MFNFNVPAEILKNNLIKVVPKLMQKNNIPGLSLVMFKGQEIIIDLQFGVKNTLTHEPIISSTVFEGASFTKPLISYAALKMCQQELLALDRPLKSYLIKPYRNDPPYLESVTLRHILHHNSGFPEYMLKENEPLTFNFIPGTQYLYSNSGFNFLLYVMEKMIDTPIAVYLQKNILQPLRMDNSSFVWEERFNTLAASPHNRKGEPVEKWKPRAVSGACSLHTTPSDFAHFMMAIIEQANKPQDKQAINMLDEQIHAEKNIYAAKGWSIEKTLNGDAFFHPGNNATFKSMGLAYKDQAFGIVFMTNSINTHKIIENLLEISVGGNHRDCVEFADCDTEEAMIDTLGERRMLKWWHYYGL